MILSNPSQYQLGTAFAVCSSGIYYQTFEDPATLNTAIPLCVFLALKCILYTVGDGFNNLCVKQSAQQTR